MTDPNPKIVIRYDGEDISLTQLEPTRFKTGSRGYEAKANIIIDGKPHVVHARVIEIGSKPKPEEKTTT